MTLTTRDGYDATLEELEIELSLLGYLEGDPLYIREKVLEQNLPRRFQDRNCGLIVRVPPPGPLPRYLVVMNLQSRTVSTERCWDYSVLAVVWFVDDLPVNLPQALEDQLKDVDWAAHAQDVMC